MSTFLLGDQQTLAPYSISHARVLHGGENCGTEGLNRAGLPRAMSCCLHLFGGDTMDHQLLTSAGESRADAEE